MSEPVEIRAPKGARLLELPTAPKLCESRAGEAPHHGREMAGTVSERSRQVVEAQPLARMHGQVPPDGGVEPLPRPERRGALRAE